MSLRAEAKQKTRDRLIEAGIELFASEGLDGPSLDAICEHAGYTRGAFYVHFKDRDDFLAAVMEAVGRPLLDVLLADRRAELDLELTVKTFVELVADGTYPLAPSGSVKPHQLLDACARSERVRELYVKLTEEAIDRVARIVRSSQEQKRVRGDVRPKTLASTLVALVIGAQIMMELGLEIDVKALSRGALALLRC
jgi:TetR/AcrR family transcriptional regulator, transcriptional repressor for nem operon